MESAGLLSNKVSGDRGQCRKHSFRQSLFGIDTKEQNVHESGQVHASRDVHRVGLYSESLGDGSLSSSTTSSVIINFLITSKLLDMDFVMEFTRKLVSYSCFTNFRKMIYSLNFRFWKLCLQLCSRYQEWCRTSLKQVTDTLENTFLLLKELLVLIWNVIYNVLGLACCECE